MKERPPELSPRRLVVALLAPLAAYLVIRTIISVALRRPLLLLAAERVAKVNSEAAARLADPARRRMVAILTAIVGTTFALDGATQMALALTVPTASFVADSTAVRIVVIGSGAVVTFRYLRHAKRRLVAP